MAALQSTLVLLFVLGFSCIGAIAPISFNVITSTEGATTTYGANSLLIILVQMDGEVNETEFEACVTSAQPQLVTNILPSGSVTNLYWIPRWYGLDFMDSSSEIVVDDSSLFFSTVIDVKWKADPLALGTYQNQTLLTFPSCVTSFTIEDWENTSTALTPASVVDSYPASISSISTRKPKGTYTTNEVIDVLVEFTDDMTVSNTGTDSGATFSDFENSVLDFLAFQQNINTGGAPSPPVLDLNSGGSARYVGYANPGNKKVLLFRYKIGLGEATPVNTTLDVVVNGTINALGYIFTGSASGQEADLSVPPLGTRTMSKANVKVIATGQKFPPSKYDAQIPPYSDGATSFNGKNAVQVSVTFDIDRIWDVSEKNSNWRTDVIRTQSWYDPRLNTSKLNPRTEVTDIKLIWIPKVTFVNAQEDPKPFDSLTIVYNTGMVSIMDRYITTIRSSMNLRDFPFDKQHFLIQISSTIFNSSTVQFVGKPATEASEAVLRKISDTQFAYGKMQQNSSISADGIHTGYSILTTSFEAVRYTSYASLTILFPLTLICLGQLFTYLMAQKADARITICASGLGLTLAFSYVIQGFSPPTNYVTKLTVFVFFTYFYCLSTLLVQLCIRHIALSLETLKFNIKEANDEAKEKKDDKRKADEKERDKGRYIPLPGEPQPVYIVKDFVPYASDEKDIKPSKVKVETVEPKENEIELSVLDGPVKESAGDSVTEVLWLGLVVLRKSNSKIWLKRLEWVDRFCIFAFLICFPITTGVILGVSFDQQVY